MIRVKTWLLLLIVSLVAWTSRPVVAQDQVARDAAADRSIQQLQQSLEKIIQDKKTPGVAVGIIKDGKLVYARGFGVMNVDDPSRPVTPETLFHMASITKPFVATSVMQLVEQGKVNLDEPVVKYLPYFQLKDPRYTTITVRQMLTHTSGMPDVVDYGWNKPEYDDGSLERYVRSLADKNLRWQPGSKFAYSNMAYEVLGDLVAKVSGKSFEDYVAANILEPVGMKSSTLLLKIADPAKLAAGHTQGKGKAIKPVAHYPYNRAHTPSSNLHSNVEDMARWVLVNLNYGELDGHRILQRSTYDVLWKPAAEAGRKDRHVGISWFLGDFKKEPFISHGGGDDGFLTYVGFSTKRNVGFVLMTNSDHAPFKEILEATVTAALGLEEKR
jgi:CubicO group peptidase (beta-lactamase class C family)